MYTNEITKALATLAELMQTQEDTYIENGGEITEETEAREEDMHQFFSAQLTSQSNSHIHT